MLVAQRATLRPSPAFGGAEVIHETWTVADGLPVNSINHLTQTRDGYIWAATFDGLVRFDGVTFTVFNSANSPGLPSNRILRLLESERGDLWIWTEQEQLVRRRAGRFTTFARPGCVWAFGVPVVHASGHDWVGTCEGLARVHGDSLVPIRRDLLPDTVSHVLRLRDGTVSIGTARRGLLRLRVGADGSAEPLVVPRDSALARRQITEQFEAPDGRLWVATDSGIWYDRNGWRQLPISPTTDMIVLFNLRADPRGRGVLFHGRGRGGTVALADDQSISVLDVGPTVIPNVPLWTSADSWWHGRRSTLKRNGVPVLTLGPESASANGRLAVDALLITTGLTDSEGSVGFGTFAGGLHRIKPTLVRTLSEPEGLGGRNVYGVYADRAGGVWVGSLGRGFSRIDARTGRAERTWLPGFTSQSVRTFLEGRDGTLWMGTDGKSDALFRCTRVPEVRCIAEQLESGVFTDVYALHEDPASDDSGSEATRASSGGRMGGCSVPVAPLVPPLISCAPRPHARRGAVDGDQRGRRGALSRRRVPIGHHGGWSAERPRAGAARGRRRHALGRHRRPRAGATRSRRVVRQRPAVRRPAHGHAVEAARAV